MSVMLGWCDSQIKEGRWHQPGALITKERDKGMTAVTVLRRDASHKNGRSTPVSFAHVVTDGRAPAAVAADVSLTMTLAWLG